MPEQSVTQLLPLQWTAPAQALPPVQEMWLMPALPETVPPQLDGPVHCTVQLLPPQETSPLHEPLPEQTTVAVAPEAETVDAQDPTPLQVTVHGLPPHLMDSVQAWSGQVTAQVVAPWQSIGVVHPPGGQVIRQPIPFGQVIG